ncbi:MAG: hypothetical protein D6797_06550 [Bdellovibrio sp.]|nr:MAG: hypothetical protein D6797_06550 [Bdellovibrio sp.]
MKTKKKKERFKTKAFLKNEKGGIILALALGVAMMISLALAYLGNTDLNTLYKNTYQKANKVSLAKRVLNFALSSEQVCLKNFGGLFLSPRFFKKTSVHIPRETRIRNLKFSKKTRTKTKIYSRMTEKELGISWRRLGLSRVIHQEVSSAGNRRYKIMFRAEGSYQDLGTSRNVVAEIPLWVELDSTSHIQRCVLYQNSPQPKMDLFCQTTYGSRSFYHPVIDRCVNCEKREAYFLNTASEKVTYDYSFLGKSSSRGPQYDCKIERLPL